MLRVLAAVSYPGDERALFRQGIGVHVRPAATTLTQRIHQVRQPLLAALWLNPCTGCAGRTSPLPPRQLTGAIWAAAGSETPTYALNTSRWTDRFLRGNV